MTLLIAYLLLHMMGIDKLWIYYAVGVFWTFHLIYHANKWK